VAGYEKDASDEEKKAAQVAAAGGDLEIAALGSGSDFTPFLQHLGIASLNIGYAAAESMALFVVILLVSIFQFRFFANELEY
jgi:hypothetical protein